MKFILFAASALAACSQPAATPIPPGTPVPEPYLATAPPAHHASRAEVDRLVDRLIRRLTDMRDAEVRHQAKESATAAPVVGDTP